MDDQSSESQAAAAITTRRDPKGVLLVVCFALFFGVLNASTVAVVLPEIANDLSIDSGQLGW